MKFGLFYWHTSQVIFGYFITALIHVNEHEGCYILFIIMRVAVLKSGCQRQKIIASSSINEQDLMVRLENYFHWITRYWPLVVTHRVKSLYFEQQYFPLLCRDSDTLRKPKKSSSTGRVALKYFNRFFFQFIIYVVVPNTILCTIGQWY